MNKEPISLTPAAEGDIQLIRALLEQNGLPGQDIDDKIGCLFMAYHGSELVGIGGMEIYGRYGLLRSLVTLDKFRGGGYGKIITQQLLDHARAEGLSAVYLLTTTAAKFFEKMGFDYIERAAVPEPIANTTEFTSLCPDSADCMMLKLRP
ncbi:MAG: GNAT family N-acetyltransferase [candidate division Zixibacteria bacterium HGW-Zixibacteria-1]|nr:MAG: GNAT family N-acetyltransferase [candidate division Zixibacteria bacterium HGW-Zixibacteria-1]